MKTSKIQILPESVINKIAAGEVVERPSSVVKELIENSLDAGSTSIDIDLAAAGSSLIRIADSGSGMSREDASLAFLRHATSKISDFNDLEKLDTLGFRGEALASIAAVSDLEMVTSTGDGEGTLVSVQGGEIKKLIPASRIRGTTIEVRNLFYNVPARKKFMKKETAELASIIETVGRFIVSHEGVEFKLSNNSRQIIHAPAGMPLIERIALVLGADTASQLTAFSDPSARYKLSGFVSKPSSTRKDRSSQLFFVNKRFVRSKVLEDGLREAYHSLLERGRFPMAVLFIEARGEDIDVNIHPTKLLVKFDDEKTLKRDLIETVRSKFREIKTPFVSGFSEQRGVPSQEVAEPEGVIAQSEFDYIFSSAKDTPAVSPSGVTQIGLCYLVRVKSDRIIITDQHAAHERVLYEYFMRVFSGKRPEAQELLFPVRLDLSPAESPVMDKLSKRLVPLGFEIEEFGKNSYVVRAYPAILKERDIKTIILDILSDFSAGSLTGVEAVEEILKVVSCRAAIKAGEKLNQEEISALFVQLEACEKPFTCPHGRPVSFEITIDEMEKRFRRT